MFWKSLIAVAVITVVGIIAVAVNNRPDSVATTPVQTMKSY